ncbi:hypothetical protein G7054_g5962 [Neopestalotiopsis clavispora]|nr:hypothetical protein G7054_g5962 [Neopestalotiopsis clavispora]
MASSSQGPRIVQLAAAINEVVAKLNDILNSQGIPTPSFEENAPTTLPDDSADVQSTILDATLELHDLILQPMELLIRKTAQNNMAPFQAISHLGIANMVPLGGQTSFRDIAEKTGLDESMVRRLLRHAITMRVFREPEPGLIAHNRNSKAITDPSINDWLKTASQDLWPTATKLFEALQKWPKSQEINQTAFALAHDTEMSIYEFFEANPDRALSFVGSLKALTSSPEYQISHVVNNYNWAALGKATVVDVGGSRGNIAGQLAERFPELNFVVQDLENVIKGAENDIPEELRGRIQFEARDLFAPQTVKADVYFMRWILHNWPDKYWCEACLPEPNSVPLWKEQTLRAADLSMTALFNAQDRTIDDWKTLLSQADSRFVLENVIEPKGSALAILEVAWVS